VNTSGASCRPRCAEKFYLFRLLSGARNKLKTDMPTWLVASDIKKIYFPPWFAIFLTVALLRHAKNRFEWWKIDLFWALSPLVRSFSLAHVWNFLIESKTVHFPPFSTFFQAHSPGYAPEKRQKMPQYPIFAFGRNRQTCAYLRIVPNALILSFLSVQS
jgi:hypothetical protein